MRRIHMTGRILACTALALAMHAVAWQTLAGVGISLSRPPDEPAPVEVALIGPTPAAAALAGRRAVVRDTAGRREPAPMQASVGTARAASRHVAKPAPASAPAPAPAAAAPVADKAPAPEPAAASRGAVPAEEPPPAPEAPLPGSPPAPPAPPSSPEAPPSPPAPAATSPPSPPPGPPAAEQAAPAEAAQRSAAQVVLPRSARFVFDSHATLRMGGFALAATGRTTMQWRFEDGRYQSDLTIDVVSFTQSSRGQFDPQVGLAPDRYTETRHRNKVQSADFDWARRRVTFADPAGEQPAEPGAQDLLSIQYQLSVLRQIYPERFVKGGQVPVMMASTRNIRPWVFTVTGEDVVDSGLGHLRALRIVSNRTTETGDESLEVWLCEQLHWLPVRIRAVDNRRNIFDFVLDEASID